MPPQTRSRMGACALLWALVSAGCALRAAPPDPCPAPELDTSGWVTVEREPYSFRLPPATGRIEPRPLSELDEWRLPGGGTFGVQWGQHATNLLVFAERPGYQVCYETIGGRQARLISHGRGREALSAAHWADVRAVEGYAVTLGLTLYALRAGPEDHRLAQAIFRTVRFRDPPD
jgi:hypothetical protein